MARFTRPWWWRSVRRGNPPSRRPIGVVTGPYTTGDASRRHGATRSVSRDENGRGGRVSMGLPVAPATGEEAPRWPARFLAGRRPNTRAAYAADLRGFGAWALQHHCPAREVTDTQTGEARRGPPSAGTGAASGLALDFLNQLRQAGRSAATINRRLAALRALIKLARLFGAVSWTLEVSRSGDDLVPSTPHWQIRRGRLMSTSSRTRAGYAPRRGERRITAWAPRRRPSPRTRTSAPALRRASGSVLSACAMLN
jgi:hypothetical protein